MYPNKSDKQNANIHFTTMKMASRSLFQLPSWCLPDFSSSDSITLIRQIGACSSFSSSPMSISSFLMNLPFWKLLAAKPGPGDGSGYNGLSSANTFVTSSSRILSFNMMQYTIHGPETTHGFWWGWLCVGLGGACSNCISGHQMGMCIQRCSSPQHMQ
uniref:Uncharacterized protein n=1 Tax=Chaetoceros debilis TaxID=122233 RepID=A0A6S8UC34_9STRA